MKIRILYIHQDGLVTGSAISLLNLIEKINKDIFEIIICLGASGPFQSILQQQGYQYVIIPFRKYVGVPPKSIFTKSFFSNLLSINPSKNLIKTIGEIKPDIIHINDKAALSAGVAAKKLDIPIVWHLRSTYSGKKSWIQYKISQSIINRAQKLIAISEDETDGFEHHPGLNIVYNSIDIQSTELIRIQPSLFRKKYNISDDQIAIGMFGNHSKAKGFFNFVKAIEILNSKGMLHEGTRIFVFSRVPSPHYGGLRKKLGLPRPQTQYEKAIKFCHKKGIKNRLEFVDDYSNILEAMRGMDVVCACYNLWAIGRPGFEAQSVGSPVIVNEGHTGKSKIVVHNKNGLVIRREDPFALASAIEKIISDKGFSIALIENGIKNVSLNFDAKKNAKKIEKIYHDIIYGNSI